MSINPGRTAPARRKPWPGPLLGLACLGFAAALPVWAATGTAPRVLKSLDYSSLPGGRMVLTLNLSSKAPKPRAFTVEHPASLSIDLPRTVSAVKNPVRALNAGNFRSVVVAQGKRRTRVVINMTELKPHTILTRGNKIRVEVGGATNAPTVQPATGLASSAQADHHGKRIENIDFRRGEGGAGRVIIKLSKSKTPIDVERRGRKVVAVFSDTRVPQRLRQRMDVLDFATPAKTVIVEQKGSAAEVVVTPRHKAHFKEVSYQANKQFNLELQPVKKESAQEANKQKFKGKRISLNFQKIKIRALLQIIADVAGVNMVVSDSVHGKMALRLNNVPWDQALHIIMISNGLGKQRKGNVIMVAPLSELAKLAKSRSLVQKQQNEAAPLHSRILQINYAKAADIASLLKSGKNSLLSKRGSVSVDTRTNSLLLQDTPERIDKIRRLVSKLDRPVKQVLISSRIIVATNEFLRDIGTRFGVTDVTSMGGNGLISTTGSAEGNDTIVNSAISGGLPATLPDLDNRFNVNLPAANPTGKIALAILGSDYLVDLELSAMQAEGKGKVISTPRIITADSQEGKIEQGLEIPYSTTSGNQGTNTEFKKAVLSLDVTPHVTPDGRVNMDLEITNDSIGQNVNSALGGQEPAINRRSLTTQVLVDNGDTVVLGGVYQRELNNKVSKIPFLGDIPLLGALFRDRHTNNSTKQLLVFITPKIINEKLKLNNH
jgi:type IV pilus assembly protein PilQ